MFLGGFFFLWKIFHKDIKNVEITGVLYDEDKNEIKNQTLSLINFMYDGDENIGSYNSKESYSVLTNENGRFFLKLKTSAFISIETLDENRDTITLKSIEIHRKKIKVDLFINEFKRIGKRHKDIN